MGRGGSECQESFRLSVDGVDRGRERDIQVINKYNNINKMSSCSYLGLTVHVGIMSESFAKGCR